MLAAPLASLTDDTSAWRLNRVIGDIRAAEWKAYIRQDKGGVNAAHSARLFVSIPDVSADSDALINAHQCVSVH